MSLMRFLVGRQTDATASGAGPTAGESAAETEAVRRIVGRLEALPPDQARLLAGMAYVLARAANADLEISGEETAAMELELRSSGLDESQAVLVVETAKLLEKTAGGTSDYLVTREFKDLSSAEQRLTVMRACFRVCAADDAISGSESSTLNQIATELDIPSADLTALRSEFAEKFSARFGFRPNS
jgi:uncharacterized tellurite resistance protein B-like protein